jgi:DNA-binding response OmpR family regulator
LTGRRVGHRAAMSVKQEDGPMAAPTVLIADEDTKLLSILALHLRNEEYDVICASEATEALEVARRERPDVLVLNVSLSLGSRRTVLDHLSGDPELLALPVIYLVPDRVGPGATRPRLPAQSSIQKPVAVGELLAKVAAALCGAGSLAGADDGQKEVA